MHCNLSLEDLTFCKKKKGKTNQLTFGVMLVHFKKYVQFPSNKANTISTQLLLQVAKHLDIDPIHVMSFDWNARTGERYRQEIRRYLGYRATNTEDIALTINYLDYRALTPLFSGHINPYGLFPLDFSKRLSIGIII